MLLLTNFLRWFSEFTKEMTDGMTGLFVGIGSALIGAHFAQPKNFKESIMYLITGFCCSIFLGGWAIEFWELKPKGASAVSFLIGISGVYIVRGVIVFASNFSKNPKVAIRDVINLWRGKEDANDSEQ